MDFKEQLKRLIAEYADFDHENHIYKDKTTITIEEKQKIEANLIALICEYLSQSGLEGSAIDSHMKKLQLFFHPDKYPVSSPESKWLQFTLSSGLIDGATCFKLVNLCEKKLKDPRSMESHFQNITTVEALIARLERDKDYAATFTQRALLESILAMLKSAEEYNHHMGDKIPIIWAQRITQLIPYLTTGYCVGFFLEELALLYAVTYALSRGGQFLERSSSGRWQMIGHAMRVFSDTIFAAVTALIARLAELNIFMVRGAITLSIDAGDGIYRLLIAPTAQPSFGNNVCTTTNNDCTALALTPQDLFGGLRFKTFELKLLTMSLEQKSKDLDSQWFVGWRLGSQKNAAIKRALRSLQRLDKNDLELAVKLERAKKIIENLTKNEVVNVKNSSTHKTLEIVQDTLAMLLKNNNCKETQELTIG